MSGHSGAPRTKPVAFWDCSKWQQIRPKKEVTDQKKGQIFSKLGKKISIVARKGIDPSANYKLHSVIEEAQTFNMPKENIYTNIK